MDGAGNVVIGDIGNKRGPGRGRADGPVLRRGDEGRRHLHVIGSASTAARALPVAATGVAADGNGNLLTFDGTLVRALAAKAAKFYGQQRYSLWPGLWFSMAGLGVSGCMR